MITIYAYNWVPDFAKGYVRDFRLRWALKEAGLPYDVKLIGHQEKLEAPYRAIQPFGQVPGYEEDGLKLFESGAIVLHIAEKSETLMPKDAAGRARVQAWVVAALNSVEPVTMQLVLVDLFHKEEVWADGARPAMRAMVERRLDDLALWLKDREWLEGNRFTAADIMMASALRNLDHTDMVTGHPVLGPYLARCLARPAYKDAIQEQMDSFDDGLAPAA